MLGVGLKLRSQPARTYLNMVKHIQAVMFCTTICLSGNYIAVSTSAIDNPLSYIEKHSEQYDLELLDFASISSIASIPDHNKDILKASEWLVHRLKKAGLKVTASAPGATTCSLPESNPTSHPFWHLTQRVSLLSLRVSETLFHHCKISSPSLLVISRRSWSDYLLSDPVYCFVTVQIQVQSRVWAFYPRATCSILTFVCPFDQTVNGVSAAITN